MSIKTATSRLKKFEAKCKKAFGQSHKVDALKVALCKETVLGYSELEKTPFSLDVTGAIEKMEEYLSSGKWELSTMTEHTHQVIVSTTAYHVAWIYVKEV